MERLTEKREGQNVIPLRQDGKRKWSLCTTTSGENFLCGDYSEQLAEYEDAEEKGLLLRLPCKLGDEVYILAGRFGTFYEKDTCDGFYLGRDKVLQIKVRNDKGNHGTYGVLGKTVFLTQEEAEEALRRMEGEK